MRNVRDTLRAGWTVASCRVEMLKSVIALGGRVTDSKVVTGLIDQTESWTAPPFRCDLLDLDDKQYLLTSCPPHRSGT
jgi:hypothetical protein